MDEITLQFIEKIMNATGLTLLLAGGAKQLLQITQQRIDSFIMLDKSKTLLELQLKNKLIESDEFNETEKALLISSYNQSLKKFLNQVKIIKSACAKLTSESKPEDIDDDWLNLFFDRAQHISNKEMQEIWSSLLSEEANKPGSIPKSLFSILSEMDSKAAKKFEKLASFILISAFKKPFALITSDSFFTQQGLDYIDLVNLESARLIQKRTMEQPFLRGEVATFSYLDKKIVVKNDQRKQIPMGEVILLEPGEALFKLFTANQKPEFIEFIIDYYKKNSCTIEVI